MTSSPRILLVGGGRWGRVHASVLMQILPAHAEILWVTRHNNSAAHTLANNPNHQVLVTVVDDIEQALSKKPNAATVVTAAHTHAKIAHALLSRGIPTFVEKPLALSLRDAEELIALAQSRNVVLGVGLHLLFASYLHQFRSLWHARQVAKIRLFWCDSELENRYGEIKRLDMSVAKIHDVFPHIWAILRVLLPTEDVLVGKAESLTNGSACLHMSAGITSVEALIHRRAATRSRRVDIFFADGGTAILDFTTEPGEIRIDTLTVGGDPNWSQQPTPLAAEITSFLLAIENPKLATNLPCLAEKVIASVKGAELAAAQLAAIEAQKLALLLADLTYPEEDSEVQSLLIDNLGPELNVLGIRIIDSIDQTRLLRASLHYLDKFEFDNGEDIFAALKEAIRKSNFLRQVVTAVHTGT